MGLRRARRHLQSVESAVADAGAIANQLTGQDFDIASPWTDRSNLETIVWAELLDAAGIGMTRTEAMSVPAIAKARHVVAPKVAETPLRLFRFTRDQANPDDLGTDTQLPQAGWMTRTDDGVSPWHRMLWTADDLIFYGWSLWAANRGSEGQLLTASRIAPSRWKFDDQGRVELDGKLVTNESSLILIPGPHEGVLTFGRTTVRHARQLLAAAAVAGQSPTAHLELHNTGEDLTDPEIDRLLDRWGKARRGANGGVGYTSRTLELKEHGAIDAQLLVDGRNAAAVDCARIVGVSAGMIDATAPKASLNYETQAGRGLEHTEYGVKPYMDAIAARLSLDDIVPRGQRVRFDITEQVGPVEPTGPTTED